jgi:glycosyltransferase involved in cell wall biosynthesis
VRRLFAIPILWIFLLGATSMSKNITRELTSIIIPVWGQLEFTRQCLASLKEQTRPEWELIVVDNGSDDGTAANLAGVRDMASVPVTVVTNTKNLGFPAAVNQGLRLARGEYLVLLNNDVIVTDGWLDQLIALVKAKRGLRPEPGPVQAVGTALREQVPRLLPALCPVPQRPPPLAPPPRGGDVLCRTGHSAHPPWPPLHKGGKGDCTSKR